VTCGAVGVARPLLILARLIIEPYMRRLSIAGVAILPIVVLYGSTLNAQQRPRQPSAYSIRWYASIVDADQLPEARSFRIYGTPDQLTVALTSVNDTAAPMSLNQAMFIGHVRFSVVGADAVPVTVTWLPEAWWVAEARGPTPILPNQTFDVGTDRGIEWRVVLRPAEADRFAAGQYFVNIDSSDEMPAHRSIHNQLAVFVGPAQNDGERADEYSFLGRKALLDGRLLEARDHLLRARAAKPSGSVALFDLGVTHLRLKEYREAIRAFEQLLSQLPPLREFSAIPGYLAHAYVGAGNDAKAAQMLQQTGLTGRDVVLELDRLRRRVRP
jgi:hypothetical protein